MATVCASSDLSFCKEGLFQIASVPLAPLIALSDNVLDLKVAGELTKS